MERCISFIEKIGILEADALFIEIEIKRRRKIRSLRAAIFFDIFPQIVFIGKFLIIPEMVKKLPILQHVIIPRLIFIRPLQVEQNRLTVTRLFPPMINQCLPDVSILAVHDKYFAILR